MPYLSFFLPHANDAQFVEPALLFPCLRNNEVIASFLVNELDTARGDAVVYVTIFMNYYNLCYKMTKALNKKLYRQGDKGKPPPKKDEVVAASLKDELASDSIGKYAEMVDMDYECEMKRVNQELMEATTFLMDTSTVN